MKCCTKNNTKTYRYKEQDLPEIFRTCKPPPPPPPGEELWELQFCRWWGWNWVKKKDELGVGGAMGTGGARLSLEEERMNKRPQQQYRRKEEMRLEQRSMYNGNERNMGGRCSPTRCNNDRQMMSSRPPYGRPERRVEKKHIKQLCNCLCFKKKPQGTPSIQNMYSTPSNSVLLHETYTCGVIHNQDSVARLEVERNISRKGRRETCRCKCAAAQPWMNIKEESESSDEGIDCQCCGKVNKSSTEESIEVLNIQCQCCCKPQRSKTPPKRQINNNHTQTITGQKAEMVQTANCGCVCATQTQNMKQTCKSTKKKRKLVVCCHCCCHCGKDDTRGEDAKVQVNPDSWDNVAPQKPEGGGGRCCCIAAAKNYTPAKAPAATNERNTSYDYNGTLNGNGAGGNENGAGSNENGAGGNENGAGGNEYGADSNAYDVYHATLRHDKMNPARLRQFKPWDAALYQQKSFPKYGAPSKNYPWVQRTTSDILDKYYRLKINEEFSSPVTGKTYNLSPIEVISLGGASIKSSLPEPMEVKEDIQYLEKLETNAKHDIPSRIMLNAMCDAILYSNIDADCPSVLLSEFTYLDKDAGGCSKNNNCSSATYVDLPRDSSNNSTQTQGASDKSIKQHVEDTVKKLLQEKEERLGGSDSTFKEHIERAGLQKVFNQEEDKEENPDHKSTESSNHFDSKQHCCFRAHEEHSIIPKLYPTFTKTGLLPSICSYKRSASPARNGQVKKSRPCLDSGDSMVQNVNDLLDQIDEIALRSQENDQKVQSVLNSIGNPEQVHIERTSGFQMNFETSLSGDMSSSEIFRKIDEIVQRSQLNNNKIQNVLNTIPKATNNQRDYVQSHHNPPCISSDDSALMQTERLTSISEMPQEATEMEVKSSSCLKLDVPSNAGLGKKKKKGGSLKSLIPIKQKPKNK